MDDLFLDENLECMALHRRGTQIDEEIMTMFSSCESGEKRHPMQRVWRSL